MNTLIAIRLDDTLDKELDKKAASLGISKSKLVRDAIADYLPRAKAVAKSVKAPVPLKKVEKPSKGKAAKPLVKKGSAPVSKKAIKAKKK